MCAVCSVNEKRGTLRSYLRNKAPTTTRTLWCRGGWGKVEGWIDPQLNLINNLVGIELDNHRTRTTPDKTLDGHNAPVCHNQGTQGCN